MMNTYVLRDNEVIVNPNTEKEINITLESKECKFCKYDKKTCKGNKEGIYCDWFTMIDKFKEVEES